MKIADLLDTMSITQEMLSAFTGIPRSRIAKWAVANTAPPKSADKDAVEGFYESHKDKSPAELKELYNSIVQKGTTDRAEKPKTGEDIRREKAFKDGAEGIAFVPISAQAGYSQHYLEPAYVKDLEHIYIPGMPYKGAKYRIFEVSGDSMEPTLKEHQHVVGERVEIDYWSSIARYYIYVVVTEDQIMVKRLYTEKGWDYFILISDNKDFYPQFRIDKKDVRELWLVKRKMDWEMPPPSKFEIDKDLLK